ncbi:hypothetical protein NPIL_319011 [Nephila pilipes]|uniref:Uncharacterized protein n=1 Tax=Nephila pilipes TaxID=299642 RepID=A0A8X6QEB8_NEPPI|nr:hypothetical protein NPIL_319011 [Nephila pilipes]
MFLLSTTSESPVALFPKNRARCRRLRNATKPATRDSSVAQKVRNDRPAPTDLQQHRRKTINDEKTPSRKPRSTPLGWNCR